MKKSKNGLLWLSLIGLIGLLVLIGVFHTSTAKAYAEINDAEGLVFYTNSTEVSIPLKNVNSDMVAIIARIDENGYLQMDETILISSGSEYLIMNIDELSEKECRDFYVTFIETDISQDFVLPENVEADGDTIYVSCNTGDHKFRKISVILDQTAPVIESVSEGNNDEYPGTVTLSVNASDKYGSGVYMYYFNGEFESTENERVFKENGEVIIQVKDRAGNLSLPYKYNIISIDKKKPEIKCVKVVGKEEAKEGFDGKEYYKNAVICVCGSDDITPYDELLFSADDGTNWYKGSIPINENGKYQIIAKDKSGKISERKEVEVNIINEAPRIEIVNITPELKDGMYTNAETIIVQFEINNHGAAYEDEAIEVKLGKQKLTKINAVDNYKYNVIIDNKGETFYCEDLSISVTDKLEQKSNDITTKISFDNKKPNICSITSSQKEEWSKSEVKYTIKVNEKESGLNEKSLNIKNENKYIKSILFNSDINGFDIIVDANDGECVDSKLKLTVTDLAGNESDEESIDIKIDKKKPDIKNIEYSVFENGKKIDKKYVKNGDKLQIIIEATDEGSGFGNDEITIYMDDNKRSAVSLSFDGVKENCIIYSALIKIDDAALEWLKDNVQLKIKEISLQDQLGNKCDNWHCFADSGITYYAPLEFESMKFEYSSDNDIKMLANCNNIINVGFVSSHEVTVDCKIGFDEKNSEISFQHELNSENKYVYRGSYKVSECPENDNSYFMISIKITDDAGNYLEPDIDDEIGKILYYAPISDSFSGLKITSDNTTNKEYAKNDDTISVAFQTSHPVSVEDARIAGKEVIFNSKDGMNWNALFQIHNEDISDDTDIEFSFSLTDLSGNESFSCNQNDTEKIRYLAPIEVKELTMSSDNEKAEFKGAKNGDVITVSFITNHPVNLTDTRIAGREAEFISEDNVNWIAQIIAENGIAEDMDYISLYFNVHDKAGNEIIQQTENDLVSEKVQYYAPISISDVEIYSSNENDGNRYAKDGDVIKVSFISNHDVEIAPASVAGNIPEISSYPQDSGNIMYELSYVLSNGDIEDQSVVLFSFTANDFAENEPVIITNESVEEINEVIYYAPIISDASIRSGNRNQLYVNNGGRITVSGSANHGVTPESAVIMGRNADVYGKNTASFSINYTIDEKEKSLTEGYVNFSYTLADSAGNILYVDSASDGSSVVYDRTLPVITAEYDKVSFTNHSVTYKFTFSDIHISSSDISIKVNGTEQITDNERNLLSGSVFTKEITLDTDNNYHVIASAKDLANNSAYPEIDVRTTIDKTNPKIKTLDISSDSPEIYRSLFNIKEHFEIDDKNLKEIICTVTNSSGTVDWNINAPVMSDGKNTVYLMATDMADNVSQAVTYDFYIDAIAPKPLVSEAISGIFMEQEENYSFSLEADLKISLEALHIDGISEPDKFIKLYITDKNGNEVADLLENYESEPGIYTISITDIGEYVLCAEAKDSVGNTNGLIKYSFEIKEKSLAERFWDNKPLVAGTASGAGIVIFVIVYVLIFKRVKKM
jgi:hypothetical protein ELI_1900